MKKSSFDMLVEKGMILKPESFSEDDKEKINKLSADEVQALVSIRAKLGHDFLQKKAAYPSPALTIVF